jgi:hypothetical protein
MPRALSGAVLNRRIEQQLRADWLTGFGLPLDQYTCKVEAAEGMAEAVFTHRQTGAVIRVDSMWYGDNGEILQGGAISMEPAAQ